MSFFAEKSNLTPDDAKTELAKESVPDFVRNFITAAIGGIEAKYPGRDDVTVSYQANGHLCDAENKDTYEVSEAHITVKPNVGVVKT